MKMLILLLTYDSRSKNYEYPLSMTEFLYEILSKNLICKVFPDDFSGDFPEFISYNVENLL